jgi:hypothetical protein
MHAATAKATIVATAVARRVVEGFLAIRGTSACGEAHCMGSSAL